MTYLWKDVVHSASMYASPLYLSYTDNLQGCEGCTSRYISRSISTVRYYVAERSGTLRSEWYIHSSHGTTSWRSCYRHLQPSTNTTVVTRQSEPRTPSQASLPTPEAVSNNVQLPPIHGYSPNLFHLRYPQQSPILTSDEDPTSQICSRELFDEIMQDYVDLLYPLVPLVHIPSFKNDLRNRREVYDKPFLAFVISICAAVVAHMPSRFYHYRSRSPPLRFTTRRAMVDFCQEKIYSMRKADWYDEMSFTKFATSYMLVCTYVANRLKSQILNQARRFGSTHGPQ